MDSINKKIIGKVICLASAVTIISTAVFISGKKNEEIISASYNMHSDKPIIILDAGHGECS